MRSYIALTIALAAAVLLGGCKQQPVAAAPLGAPPAIGVPVGPLPGPGKEAAFLPANPYQGNAIARVEGRRLFIWYNCYGCHGGHAGGGMGPSLRDPNWRYGSDDAHIFSSIAEGRAHGMPAWGTKIPSEQIWKLVAYIKSLRTPDEPDPPMVPHVPEVKPGSTQPPAKKGE